MNKIVLIILLGFVAVYFFYSTGKGIELKPFQKTTTSLTAQENETAGNLIEEIRRLDSEIGLTAGNLSLNENASDALAQLSEIRRDSSALKSGERNAFYSVVDARRELIQAISIYSSAKELLSGNEFFNCSNKSIYERALYSMNRTASLVESASLKLALASETFTEFKKEAGIWNETKVGLKEGIEFVWNQINECG